MKYKPDLLFIFFAVISVIFSSVLFSEYPLGFLDGEHYSRSETNMSIINTYSQPEGELIGEAELKFRRGLGLAYQLYLKEHDYTNTEYFLTGYKNEFHFIHYYAISNGYIKIYARTIDGGVWIKGSDIEGKLTPTTFIEDITKYSTWQIYGYDNYRLRSAPSLKGEIIITLDVKKHVIKTFTGKIKGSWAEAVIYEIQTPLWDCYDTERLNKVWTKKKWKGWIKIVDDAGQINDIYYYYSC